MEVISFSRAIVRDIRDSEFLNNVLTEPLSVLDHTKGSYTYKYIFISNGKWLSYLGLDRYFQKDQNLTNFTFPATHAAATTLRITHGIFLLYLFIEIVFYFVHRRQRRLLSEKPVRIDKSSIPECDETIRKIIETESGKFEEYFSGMSCIFIFA